MEVAGLAALVESLREEIRELKNNNDAISNKYSNEHTKGLLCWFSVIHSSQQQQQQQALVPGQIVALEEIRFVVKKQELEIEALREKLRDNVSTRTSTIVCIFFAMPLSHTCTVVHVLYSSNLLRPSSAARSAFGRPGYSLWSPNTRRRWRLPGETTTLLRLRRPIRNRKK